MRLRWYVGYMKRWRILGDEPLIVLKITIYFLVFISTLRFFCFRSIAKKVVIFNASENFIQMSRDFPIPTASCSSKTLLGVCQ
jgi:hypothetical protein